MASLFRKPFLQKNMPVACQLCNKMQWVMYWLHAVNFSHFWYYCEHQTLSNSCLYCNNWIISTYTLSKAVNVALPLTAWHVVDMLIELHCELLQETVRAFHTFLNTYHFVVQPSIPYEIRSSRCWHGLCQHLWMLSLVSGDTLYFCFKT